MKDANNQPLSSTLGVEGFDIAINAPLAALTGPAAGDQKRVTANIAGKLIGTLATFQIPEAGLALLLGIDPLLDMGRSATNVVGNSVATAVVSKWENSLDAESND